MTESIPLSQGRYALIDDEDFDRISQFKWSYDQHGYASRRNKAAQPQKMYLHRFVIGAPAGMEVDHINHDRLDNRRSNLRLATRQENSRNMRSRGKSRYKGVKSSFHKWQAEIKISGKTHYLGSFPTEIEAAEAYDQAAREIYGEFAHLNFEVQQ